MAPNSRLRSPRLAATRSRSRGSCLLRARRGPGGPRSDAPPPAKGPGARRRGSRTAVPTTPAGRAPEGRRRLAPRQARRLASDAKILQRTKTLQSLGIRHGRPAPHHRPLDQHLAIGRRRSPAPDAHRERALRERLRKAGAAWQEGARRPRRRSNSGGSGPNTTSTSRNARCCTGTRCASAATSGSSTKRPGKPPVLTYKYEMIADARDYARPANYALVRIIPPKGVAIDDASARS